MKIRYITPEQQKWLDETGQCRLFYKKFTRDFRELLPRHVRSPQDDPTAFIRQYVEVTNEALSNGHRPYTELQIESLSKVGRQGGCFPLEKLQELVLPYFERYTDAPMIVAPELLAARDYLLERVRDRIHSHGGISYVSFRPSSKATFAGLRTAGKRGTFNSETVGFTLWRHPLPAMPGERFMRNSPRSIFMLANADYRYMEAEFTLVRHWLRSEFPEYFSAWLNPNRLLYPQLARWSRSTKHFLSIEEDYVKMDTYFSFALVAELLFPIYEELLQERFLKWACYVEESFSAPVYWGEYLWEGNHNLLSGLPYTNDFETLYSVILQLATVLKEGLSDYVILALGDDLTLLSRVGKTRALRMHEDMLKWTSTVRLKLHDDEKARISETDIRFLRRVYYSRLKHPLGLGEGAYPSALCLNNILQPEELQHTAVNALAADLQRLDGCISSPDYPYLMQMYARLLTPDAISTFRNSDSSAVSLEADWWDQLYGTTWNLDSSYSAINLRRLISSL